MLPQKNRLKKAKEIERVFKKGKLCKEGFLFFRFIENSSHVSRFGFMVGQKVSKKAVERNKIKRRMRAVVKKELSNIRPGFDVVLVALKGLEKKGFKEIESLIKDVVQRSGICR